MSTAAPFQAIPELRTELTVGGMHCSNCSRHVEEALAEIPGVRAEVDLAGAAAVVHHPASVQVQDLLDAVDEAGYEVTVKGSGPR